MTLMRAILAILICIVAVQHPQSAAAAERRIALVIGNSAYRSVAPLANPGNDARLVADSLRRLGFTLVAGGPELDLDKAAFDGAVQDFGRQIAGADVALFYYAGHGIQARGSNYLVPISANPTREADIDFQMVDAQLILRQMEDGGTKLNIVILDACRNNPFGGRGLRSMTGGLAQMQAPQGTLISYATQPGNVAADGPTGHSPYTSALVDAIQQPGLAVFDVFNAVGLKVQASTGGVQQPWVASSPLSGQFFFVPSGSTVTIQTPTTQSAAPDAELLFWQTILNSTNPDDFKAYLAQYPQGRFAGLARLRAGAAPQRAASIAPAAADESETACDAAASSSSDSTRPPNVAGVAIDRIEADRAIPACERAVASHPGHARLQFQLARSYENAKRYADAARLYRAASDEGFAPAQNNLGALYQRGTGVAKSDADAVRLFRLAAAQGFAMAQYHLAALYEKGLSGLPRDPEEAMRLYQLAARAGNAPALQRLRALGATR